MYLPTNLEKVFSKLLLSLLDLMLELGNRGGGDGSSIFGLGLGTISFLGISSFSGIGSGTTKPLSSYSQFPSTISFSREL